MNNIALSSGLVACALGWLACTHAQATAVTILNVDPVGVGFNDPTPAAPVGGNPGATIGEQRLFAFELAGQIWGDLILSDVEIVVRASFSNLSCTPNSAVLGSAGPTMIFANFGGNALSDTWYVGAQADALSGSDRDPGNDDIRATFNAAIDNNNGCLSNRDWYYGVDNDPPGNDIDFLNTVMHEIGHGLGFISVVNLDNGALPSNRPSAFDRLAFDNNQQLHLSEMNNGQRLAAISAGSALLFDGPQTNLRAADYLSAGIGANGFVRLYAPGNVQPGSSVSHFDASLLPHALMEPALNASIVATRNVDLTANFMHDIGWPVADSDQDLVPDINDNCVIVANTGQENGDTDNFGNACDADLNNDGVVNVIDLGILKQVFFTADPAADLNVDGVVNVIDLGIVKAEFFGAPGPTGLIYP